MSSSSHALPAPPVVSCVVNRQGFSKSPCGRVQDRSKGKKHSSGPTGRGIPSTQKKESTSIQSQLHQARDGNSSKDLGGQTRCDSVYIGPLQESGCVRLASQRMDGFSVGWQDRNSLCFLGLFFCVRRIARAFRKIVLENTRKAALFDREGALNNVLRGSRKSLQRFWIRGGAGMLYRFCVDRASFLRRASFSACLKASNYKTV